MANYQTLKSAIQEVVKTNGNNEITGALLQQILLAMINLLGSGYQFVGIATPTTNPGTPDQHIFYIANGSGVYVNFGGIFVDKNDVYILCYDSAWHQIAAGIVSKEKFSELEGKQSIDRNNIEILRNTALLLSRTKVDLPSADNYGTIGQVLRSVGNGTEWANVGQPTDLQTEEAVRKWLDEHPEATTTVGDGSLTIAKFTEATKQMIVKDFITPEMFGAVGDGVTDDTVAFIDMFKYCQSHTISHSGVYYSVPIVFGNAKKYYFSNPFYFADAYRGSWLNIYGNGSFILGNGWVFPSNCGYKLKMQDVTFADISDVALTFNTQNTEYGNYHFDNVTFTNVAKSFVMDRRSCMVEIHNCHFMYSLVGDFKNVDRLYFHHNWVEPNVQSGNYVSVINQQEGEEGAMFVYDNLFVPVGGVDCVELAWIEVNEHARIYNNRFGGENFTYHPLRIGAGFKPKGDLQSKYPYVSFDHNDEVSGLTSILFESIAGNMLFEANQGYLGGTKGIEWSNKVSETMQGTLIDTQSAMLNLVYRDNAGRAFYRTNNEGAAVSAVYYPHIPANLQPMLNRGLHNLTKGNGGVCGISWLTLNQDNSSVYDILIHNQPFIGVTSGALGVLIENICNFRLMTWFGYGYATNYDFSHYTCILSFALDYETLTPHIYAINGNLDGKVDVTINGQHSINLTTIKDAKEITIGVRTLESNHKFKHPKAIILDIPNSSDLYV